MGMATLSLYCTSGQTRKDILLSRGITRKALPLRQLRPQNGLVSSASAGFQPLWLCPWP